MSEFLSDVKMLRQRARQHEEEEHAKDLMGVWLRERSAMLARQLAANAEIKQRWMESNPIEIRQRQQGSHVNAQMQANAVGEQNP